MNKLKLLLLLACLPIMAMYGKREITDFNKNWKFHLGNVENGQNENYDDKAWRTLDVPHDWSIEQNYTTTNTAGSTAFLPTGIGWYRKSFTIAEDKKGKIITLEFDGVYHNSEVWVNGQLVGGRPYGYLPFSCNITSQLNYGKENTVAVKVDHSKFAATRWYSGSGIYRPVRLVSTSTTHIPQWGSWVDTPQVSDKHAKVDIYSVVKAEKAGQKLVVKTLIKDNNGAIVSTRSSKLTSSKSDTIKSVLSVKNPQRWSIETPTLYTAEIKILDGKNIIDNYSYTFGIRTIRFDSEKGFFLNEKPVKLKGVCLHHDAGAAGAVFYKNVWTRRFSNLKEIGVNAIRMSHNPADPAMLQLCDEMGFVIINEAFDEWRRNKDKWITSRFSYDMREDQKTGYGDIYEEWAERDAKDLVRYSRHHPSIVMWSMGNEIEWTYPYYWKMEQSNQGLGNQVLVAETGDSIDELKETAIEIRNWIKEIDTTRPVTTGGVLPKAGNTTGYFDVPDVMGYNYRAVSYDDDHKNYPNRCIYGSENWGTYQEWKDAKDRDFVAGLFIWTGIAYMGESGPYPWKGLEISLLDFAGFYTPRGHFFRTLWNDKPYTYIATKHAKKAQWICKNGEWIDNRVVGWLDKWKFEDVEETWNYENGDSVFVEVYSNAPEVELFVNKKSYGVKKPSDFKDNIVKYLVAFEAGQIKAIGLGNEKSEYSISTAKWANKIILKADRTTIDANGNDVAHIEAYLTDAKGNIVPDKPVQILFDVEGAGKRLAVDNGWENNVQPHHSDMIVTHNGKALMLLQSNGKVGEIKVKAQVGKFISNKIIITAE